MRPLADLVVDELCSFDPFSTVIGFDNIAREMANHFHLEWLVPTSSRDLSIPSRVTRLVYFDRSLTGEVFVVLFHIKLKLCHCSSVTFDPLVLYNILVWMLLLCLIRRPIEAMWGRGLSSPHPWGSRSFTRLTNILVTNLLTPHPFPELFYFRDLVSPCLSPILLKSFGACLHVNRYFQ